MTNRASRSQLPAGGGRCQRAGASAFTRGPSRASAAGSATRAVAAAIRGVSRPPIPIE